MFTNLQYRVLRRIAPSEPTHLSGAAYLGKSKLQVLLGVRLLGDVHGKHVVDFGCGEGLEAIELARSAASVFGLDIQERLLVKARAHAEAAGVSGRCRFGTTTTEPADVIVALDSFEHFRDPAAILATMFELLRPGGLVLASFGPTWYHPYGGHLFSVFPWAHLLFSERALIRWRSDIRSDGATRFHEVEGGLNGISIRRFERIVGTSRFRVDSLETVPIRRLAAFHNQLTREFTTAIVRCRLVKSE